MIYRVILLLSIFFVPLYLLFQILLHPQSQSTLIKPLFNAKMAETSQFQARIPTIEQLFSANHEWIATLSAQRLTTVIATGDIIPARSTNSQTIKHKDFKWPYLKVSEMVKNADITFINLESPLVNKCPVTDEGMLFCGDSQSAEGLVYAGIDVASLANNHVSDHGITGIDETVSLLQGKGILATGIKGAVFKNIRGKRFAFLGYNDIGLKVGISNTDEAKIRSEILEARKQADLIIVTFHWGVEYTDYPDKRQRYLGRLAIDSGADLIIGNHPHWIQPVEIYKDKLITYAHGNFIFDQMWSQKTREGVVGKYTFYQNQLIDVLFLPVQIDGYGQPHFAEGAQKDTIIKEMRQNSLKLATDEGLLKFN